MPRASCRSSVIAAFVDVWASEMSSFAAAGSESIFCCASPRVIPTDTSRGCTPSWRSRSIRVRSTSAARTAPARCAWDCRACSARSASREGIMIARASTPCKMARPTMVASASSDTTMPTGTAHAVDTSIHVLPRRTASAVPAYRGENASATPDAVTPTRLSTIQPRMVAIAPFATARHMPGSMNCSQIVWRKPPNPGLGLRRGRRAGSPKR